MYFCAFSALNYDYHLISVKEASIASNLPFLVCLSFLHDLFALSNACGMTQKFRCDVCVMNNSFISNKLSEKQQHRISHIIYHLFMIE